MSRRPSSAPSAYRKANRAERSEIKRMKREERWAAKRRLQGRDWPMQSGQVESPYRTPREAK